MTSAYAHQSIIHSKVSWVEKKKGQYTMGRLIKGNLVQQTTRQLRGRSQAIQKQIIKEIEFLPKTKQNIAKSMNKTGLSSAQKNIEHIVFMQSTVFPSIYFKKTTLRNILKEFIFPNDVKALHPSDDRTPLIYQIVSNLFNQINFYIFNILVGQNIITNNFYIFFSDSQTIPYSKCCNAPVYIELTENGSGKVLCNSNRCESSNLAEFLINFEDGKKLWKNLRYFADASEKDKTLRQKISKLINNGKYKKINLISVVQDTSKEIVNLFYSSKEKPINHEIDQNQEQLLKDDDPFITRNYVNNPKMQKKPSVEPNQKELNEQLGIPEQLPNTFMSSTYYDFKNKISQGLVNECKIFHKDFGLIKKIDSYILDKKRTKNNTKLNFPRIISEFHKEKKSLGNPQDSLQDIKNMINSSVNNEPSY